MKPYLEGKTKEALLRAAETIERLQREREFLQVKANAFDAFASMMHLLNRQGAMSYGGVDVAHILRTLLAEIEAAEKPDQAETKYDPYPNRRPLGQPTHDMDGFDDDEPVARPRRVTLDEADRPD